jgi:hypothetical protein
MLYPLERLSRARGTLDTHHPTDTHWNGWGAFVAYRAVAEELRRRGMGLSSSGDTRSPALVLLPGER